MALKKEKGNDIIAYGGNSFASSLIEYGLVDEYYFLLNPLSFDGDLILKKLKNNSNVF